MKKIIEVSVVTHDELKEEFVKKHVERHRRDAFEENAIKDNVTEEITLGFDCIPLPDHWGTSTGATRNAPYLPFKDGRRMLKGVLTWSEEPAGVKVIVEDLVYNDDIIIKAHEKERKVSMGDFLRVFGVPEEMIPCIDNVSIRADELSVFGYDVSVECDMDVIYSLNLLSEVDELVSRCSFLIQQSLHELCHYLAKKISRALHLIYDSPFEIWLEEWREIMSDGNFLFFEETGEVVPRRLLEKE